MTPIAANAELNELLKKISDSSKKIKIYKAEKKSKIITANTENIIFSLNNYIEASYAHQKNSSRTINQSLYMQKQYNFGISKLWKSGIDTELTYSLSDSRFNSDSVLVNGNIYRPSLELSVSTRLFQDVFGKRYHHYSNQSDEKIIAITELYKDLYKTEVISGLLAILNYESSVEEAQFQEKICKQSKSQHRKNKRKKSRGSISKRDLLLSQQEVLKCDLSLAALNKKKIELEKNFEINFDIPISTFEGVTTTQVLGFIRQAYSQQKSALVNIGGMSRIKSLEASLQAEKSRVNELKAKAKNNLLLQLSTGVRGGDSSYPSARNSVNDFDNPYLTVGLKMDMPWSKRSSAAELKSAMLLADVAEFQLNLEKDSVLKRIESLKLTLDKDFMVYDKYSQSISLSEKIYDETKKDYNNGRADFEDLVRASNNTVESKKTLSSFRSQLIASVVEYLDYFNYFNGYNMVSNENH